MNVLVFTLLGILAFHVILYLLCKFDKNSGLTFRKNLKISLLIFICTILIYKKYLFTIHFIFLFYLLIYLIIVAYIDQKTKYVYSFLTQITFAVSLIYFFINRNSLDTSYVLFNAIIYIALAFLLGKLGIFGMGDSEIFISITLFICCKYINFPLEMSLINIILSNIILLVLNFKKFDIKKLKFKTPIAFAPAIFLSTIVLLLL